MTAPVDYIAQANLIHDNGPYVTPPSMLYFTYLRTDGDSFVGPASHAEQYLRMGYTISGEQTIENFSVFIEEQSAKATKAAEPAAHAESHAAKPAKVG